MRKTLREGGTDGQYPEESSCSSRERIETAARCARSGPADPSETLSVSLCLRPRSAALPLPDHAHWVATPPGKRKFLSAEEFAGTYGAAPRDLAAISRFAHNHGLEVVETSIPGLIRDPLGHG